MDGSRLGIDLPLCRPLREDPDQALPLDRLQHPPEVGPAEVLAVDDRAVGSDDRAYADDLPHKTFARDEMDPIPEPKGNRHNRDVPVALVSRDGDVSPCPPQVLPALDAKPEKRLGGQQEKEDQNYVEAVLEARP